MRLGSQSGPAIQPGKSGLTKILAGHYCNDCGEAAYSNVTITAASAVTAAWPRGGIHDANPAIAAAASLREEAFAERQKIQLQYRGYDG